MVCGVLPGPHGLVLVFSFLTSADFGGIEFKFGLDNYPQLLRNPIYLKVFFNTLVMVSVVPVGRLPAGLFPGDRGPGDTRTCF